MFENNIIELIWERVLPNVEVKKKKKYSYKFGKEIKRKCMSQSFVHHIIITPNQIDPYPYVFIFTIIIHFLNLSQLTPFIIFNYYSFILSLLLQILINIGSPLLFLFLFFTKFLTVVTNKMGESIFPLHP